MYDLALIIVNQCSMIFFDRTKLVDERPEVFDIFNDAIGHIVSVSGTLYILYFKN